MKKSAPFLLLIVLFAVVAWYSFTKAPDEVHELPTAHTAPSAPVLEEQAEPAAVIEEIKKVIGPELEITPIPLPLLYESDPEVMRAMAGVFGADVLAEYLVKTEVISRIVVTVDSLTSRQVPVQINPVKPAEDTFIADVEGDRVTMSDQNFARYDGHVELMQNVGSDTLVALYKHYSPLFQQAWEENGGEGSFHERLIEVIDHLLSTPDVPGPVYLTKPEAVYVFEDSELEAMSAGQKILVRMGSVNASVVKGELSEVRGKL
jgi:hypothetical protein